MDPKRGPDFAKFCSETLGTIHPELVLVTGDLTDAKEKDRIGSQQYLKEWETYNKILRETNVTQMFPWLDIRGNHGKLYFNLTNDNFKIVHDTDSNW